MSVSVWLLMMVLLSYAGATMEAYASRYKYDGKGFAGLLCICLVNYEPSHYDNTPMQYTEIFEVVKIEKFQ